MRRSQCVGPYSSVPACIISASTYRDLILLCRLPEWDMSGPFAQGPHPLGKHYRGWEHCIGVAQTWLPLFL